MSFYQEQIDQNNYQEQIEYAGRKFSRESSSDIQDQQNHHNQPNKKPTYNNNNISNSDQQNSSSQKDSHESSQQSNLVQLTKEQRLEAEILDVAIEQQQSTPYQHQLTVQLFEKLKDFRYLARSKYNDELVTVRIQELVINKLLVLTYNKHELRLILSHHHLGQAYLLNECIEQSIEHISVALHKIEKLFQAIPECRLLQTFMQNQLAKALIQKENYQDAIQLLNQSIRGENQLKEEQKRKHQNENVDQKNTKALVLLSQCYAKINDYEQSLNVIDEVISITRKKKMAKEEYAFALVERAKVLALQKNFTQAIANQEQAIDILMEQNYSKPQEVAELYTVLSSYHEEIGNVQNSLTCIQKVKTLYQELYSAEDKRVIKARRKIATFLLKSERFKEAVNQLLQVAELQEKVFGQNSLQTARTLKLLGAVYISMQVADARAYLKRAMNIFLSHGNKKQVQQIRDKLKMLYNGGETENKDVRLTGSQHQI